MQENFDENRETEPAAEEENLQAETEAEVGHMRMKITGRDLIFKIFCLTITVIWIFFLLIPPYWLIISSLKDGTDAFKTPPSFTPTMPIHMFVQVEANGDDYTEEDFKVDSTKMLWMMCERQLGENASDFTVQLVRDGLVVAENSISTMTFSNVRYDLFPGDLNEAAMDVEKKMDAMLQIQDVDKKFITGLAEPVQTYKQDGRTEKLFESATWMIDPNNEGFLNDNERVTMDCTVLYAGYKNQPSAIFNNWYNAWRNFEMDGVGFFGFLKNSAFIAIACILLHWLLNGMTGFGLSKIVPRRLSKPLLMYFIVPMMIPGIAATLPTYILLMQMGLTNNLWGVIIPALASTTNIVLFKGFFDEIPREMFEAADVDGASRMRIFVQIYVPMSLPAFSVIAMFTFVGQWNNFFWPFMLLKDTDKMTFPIVIQQLMNANAGKVDFATAMSMSVLVSIPTLILFGGFQKQLTNGLALGALKG